MPNNKSKIIEDLVTGPEIVRGIKAFKKERVDEGQAAVITIDGKYRETLPPGPIYLAKFPVLTRCKVYWVDTRDRQLTVASTGELTIHDPAPVLVDLTTVVTYRVVDPKVVALEVMQSLATLFDFTMDAMRDAVRRIKFHDFLVGGQAARWILQHLRARGLREYLGIEIVNVNVSHIGANPRVQALIADESLRQRELDIELKEQTASAQAAMQLELDRAYNQRDVAKLTELSPAYLALYQPELFETMFGNQRVTDELRLQALVEMAKMGVISPSALPEGGKDLSEALVKMLGGTPTGGGPVPGLAEGLAESGAQRVHNEYTALRDAGLNTSLKRLDSGEHAMLVALRDDAGHTLSIYMVYPEQYPSQPPQVFVELDGKEEQYQSAMLRNWSPQYAAVDLVGEIMRYYS